MPPPAFDEREKYEGEGEEPDVFPNRYGSQANLMDHYRINADGVVASVQALLDGQTPRGEVPWAAS